MKQRTKITALLLVVALIFGACSTQAQNTEGPSSAGQTTDGFDWNHDISVMTREEGSGTRSAFVELLEILDEDKVDQTSVEAAITNNTAVMMTSVAGDVYGMGYISLGSLNDTIKAVAIDGVEPSIENIKNGTYKIARQFNIVTKEGLSDAAKEFITYICSTEGQKIVEENGYIPLEDTQSFTKGHTSGKVVIAGSSSVTPVMEKLKEAYAVVNPDVKIEVNQSDSTTGVRSVVDDVCDIGMASRELKDSELEQGVVATTIAIDGIVVIVNKENPTENLQSEQIKQVYMAGTAKWQEVKSA